MVEVVTLGGAFYTDMLEEVTAVSLDKAEDVNENEDPYSRGVFVPSILTIVIQ